MSEKNIHNLCIKINKNEQSIKKKYNNMGILPINNKYLNKAKEIARDYFMNRYNFS